LNTLLKRGQGCEGQGSLIIMGCLESVDKINAKISRFLDC